MAKAKTSKGRVGGGRAAEESAKGVRKSTTTNTGNGKAGKGKSASESPQGQGIWPKKGGPAAPGSKNPERRCKAKKANSDEQCKRAAIKGGTVCTTHGGSAPNVRKAAQERLLELVEPALVALGKVLRDKHADDSVKVRAAIAILDRTGHGPSASLTVQDNRWDRMLEGMAGELDLDRDLPSDDSPRSKGKGKPAAVDNAIDAEWWEEGTDHDDDDDTDPYPTEDTAGDDSVTYRDRAFTPPSHYTGGKAPAGNSDDGSHPLDFRTSPRPVAQSEMDMTTTEKYSSRRIPTHEERLAADLEDGLQPRNSRYQTRQEVSADEVRKDRESNRASRRPR